MACACLLAVTHVNQRDASVVPALQSLMFNVSINSTIHDTGGIEFDGLLGYRNARLAGASAIVGPARSAVSIPVALQGALDDVPNVAYWSSSPTLSDARTYPLFARTFPDDVAPLTALLHLIVAEGWANIGVLHASDVWASVTPRASSVSSDVGAATCRNVL